MFVLDKIECKESESEIGFDIFMSIVYERLGGAKIPPHGEKRLKINMLNWAK